ncbi:tRNA(Met) cytidine acetyltransferase TmcA [Sulfuracidifex metallicus]|uniref:tRNA(Met) cytidine acetyltransferase TmcA n=1 Tax=Sulfuracidifex metallicus DSM 6482 = JCM 9184 TaxID=523847 RepID=A0A6A9QKT2_SULME|nr:GNAT family N-acetyltransferase [Sulfuracidifex metallicus]MUN28890.1 GNAT family N-acetyltransferase [Sulfuracidifex metallicus DSM 6482 = JCM 9184]WOE50599.1 GNAT family N-acetyltransferase [Sulfuracidifex metallicus DSM 6482 = JCM 9184]
MGKDEFFNDLAESIKDGIQRNYRNLVFIQSKDSYLKMKSVLKLYLSIKDNVSIVYGFHPWIKEAKDRMRELREELEDYRFEDVDYSNAEWYMGNTYDVVIMDMTDNFQPNNVGRMVELCRGGGLIIIYTDNLKENKLFKNSIMRDGKVLSFYEDRFLRKLSEHEGIFIINGDVFQSRTFTGQVESPPERKVESKNAPSEIHELCKTVDQDKALEGLYFIMSSGKRSISITAPRGRGKSAVVGLFLASLSSEDRKKPLKVYVTSPSIAGASQIFEFMVKGLENLGVEYSVKKNSNVISSVNTESMKVSYIPPDAAYSEEGDILVVDEAAALGIAYIDMISRTWTKTIMVTTVHGYEGSSKAFSKYLRKLADNRKIKLKNISMDYPLRYAKGDPVEKWLYDALLLDAEPELPEGDLSILSYEEIPKEELFTDDSKLRQAYGIMVTAHYRNNPDDLMIMADGVHHIIRVLSSSSYYVSVAQLSEEGGMDDDKVELAINGGIFDGDLIPDRVIKHVRIKEFGKLHGWRVVRIATAQEIQDKGLGSEMLRMIIEEAEDNGLDWVGSSFMGDPKVLRFWIKNGFIPVHVSPKRNEKLGDFPVVVVKPISEKAKKIVSIAATVLKEKLLNTLHDVYFNMNPEIARLLINGTGAHKEIDINPIYLDKVLAFVKGTSPYESSADGIHMLVLKYFWDSKRKWSIMPDEEEFLIAKVIQGKPWGNVSAVLSSSRSQVTEGIYTSVAEMLNRYYGLTIDSPLGVMISQHGDLNERMHLD